MDNRINVLCGLLLLGQTLLPGFSLAADPDGGAAGDWLSCYAGARAAGMGGAFVAVADDGSGMLWNPAGVVGMQRGELQLGTVRLFESTKIDGISFALPNRTLPSFGLTLLAMRSDEFERTSVMNEPLGTFALEDKAFLATAGLGLGKLAIGGNVRLLSQTVEDYRATGTGLDLGAIYEPLPAIRVGASLLNVGGPTLTLRDTDEKVPTELRVGGAVRLLGGAALVSAELDRRDGPGTTLRAGTEVWLMRSLGLRLGHDGPSVCGGFGYRFPTGLQLDYAATDHELGMTHRVGLTYRFGGFHASSRATPEVFSPTGQQPVTRFQLAARTRAEAREWSLEIRNASDEIVRSFGGPGLPPAHVVWDGKSEAGLPQPDGAYRYRLTVRDTRGQVMESREKVVEISTGGPQGSVPVIVD